MPAYTATASVEVNDQLMCLDLADSDDGSSYLPIDILIGYDHYWNLVMGSVCCTEKGLTAIHTKLDWVLSDPALLSSAIMCSSTHTTTIHVLQVESHPTKST